MRDVTVSCMGANKPPKTLFAFSEILTVGFVAHLSMTAKSVHPGDRQKRENPENKGKKVGANVNILCTHRG